MLYFSYGLTILIAWFLLRWWLACQAEERVILLFMGVGVGFAVSALPLGRTSGALFGTMMLLTLSFIVDVLTSAIDRGPTWLRNASTWHQRAMQRFLERRGWVVFYLPRGQRRCSEGVCYLHMYNRERAHDSQMANVASFKRTWNRIHTNKES